MVQLLFSLWSLTTTLCGRALSSIPKFLVPNTTANQHNFGTLSIAIKIYLLNLAIIYSSLKG
jgi:hypothetical protein